ncbi:unnamed protein product [Caenorhabditis brenneri]
MRPRNLAEFFKSDFEQESGETSVKMLILKENFIEMQTTSDFHRSWKFGERKNGCHIIAKSSMESKFTYSNFLEKLETTAEAELVKILKKILKKYKVETLRTAVRFNTAPDFSNITASIKNLEIKYRIDKKLWLSLLNAEVSLDSFSIFSVLELPYRIPDGLTFEEIANPLVINAKKLRSAQHIDMTEEQFFSLKATRMAIGVGSDFKVDTVFEFIRRWVNNEINEDFRQMELWTIQDYMEEFRERMDEEEFDATLYQHPNRYPNEEFFVKFNGYNPRNNYFYEIRNRENQLKTLSILVKTTCIVIYRTGLLRTTNEVMEAEWLRPEGLIYLHLHSNPALNV